MDGRREEDQQSMFETSHVLGSLLASSNLLPQAWSRCANANTAGSSGLGFTVELVDDIVYVTFSGIQPIVMIAGGLNDGGFLGAIPIASGRHRLFSPLDRGEDGEPVLVHACALQLFLAVTDTSQFQMMVKEIMTKKAVILTGHGLGGSLASLTTLYLLCLLLRSVGPSPNSLLCITFGSPLLGNEALSQAVLRERWGGKFCHVVAQHDIVPRLLFCPPNSVPLQLITHLLQSWQFAVQLSDKEKHELHQFVSMHIVSAATEAQSSDPAYRTSAFRPLGSYLMCSTEGAICVDNPTVIMRMLSLTFGTGCASSTSIAEEQLSYGDIVLGISEKLLVKKRIVVSSREEVSVSRSNYRAGIALALEASGIGSQDMASIEANECLKISKFMGRSPNLNGASLAIRLAKITPRRAQIEWYKVLCDDDNGYYDAFKLRRASKRDSMVNMNRIKLAGFWDDVVDMLRSNRLPHDFHRRDKWVNAAHFYRLLVEPLDIAEYYRTETHKKKGHYLAHGREGRYEMFDGWWREGRKDLNDRKRSKFAGLTQDSCFWARVEEAREWVQEARREVDPIKMVFHVGNLNGFECYAKELVERKEVSKDVVAPRSSYSLWVEEWKDLKLELMSMQGLDEKESRNGIISIMS